MCSASLRVACPTPLRVVCPIPLRDALLASTKSCMSYTNQKLHAPHHLDLSSMYLHGLHAPYQLKCVPHTTKSYVPHTTKSCVPQTTKSCIPYTTKSCMPHITNIKCVLPRSKKSIKCGPNVDKFQS